MSFVTQLLVGWLGLARAMVVRLLIQGSTGNAGTVNYAWTFGIGSLT